ncbi:MAG: aminopeptidase P family protein [Clostridiales bacterium]
MKKQTKKLKNLFEKYNCDSILISKFENYSYFSGFTGSYAYLLVTKDINYLFTDFRYFEQALLEAPECELVKVNNDFYDCLRDRLNSHNVKRIVFEGNTMTYTDYDEIKKHIFDIDVVSAKNDIDDIRMIKDKKEIEKIKKAVEIADLTFNHILEYIKPNISEKDIAAEMEYFMKKNGATKESFQTIVASGYRSSMPHGIASDKIIEKGEAILLDFGAVYEGYCSDMTRTVFLGNPKDDMLKIYTIVLEAQNKAIEFIRDGVLGIEVDLVARKVISDAGYEKCFGHGLGHGVGLEIHEGPKVSPSGKNTLLKNMVTTIEPGIYLSGNFGVRIEDIVVVEDKKSKILTGSTKEIIIL